MFEAIFIEMVRLPLSASVYDIFATETCMTLTLIFRIGQGRMYIFQSKVQIYDFIYAGTIVMFTPAVTIYEIIAVAMCV